MFKEPQTFPFRPVRPPPIIGGPLVASFTKRAPADAEGIHLEPGRYFVDTSESEWVAALPALLKVLPQSAFEERVDSDRGNIMVSVRVQEPTLIPRALGAQTGHFYELGGATLLTAHDSLYGASHREPRGFWDWLLEEHPTAFRAAQTTAEAIDETAKGVADAAKKTGDTLLKVAIGALAALLVISLISSASRRRLEGDTE